MHKTIILISILAFSACSGDKKESITTINYEPSKDKVDLNISFVDKKWDGKVVPKDEICSDHHAGGGHSPSLKISNLPAKTNYIIMAFSDETFKGMRDGGHGTVGYEIKAKGTTVTIPSIKGETFTLPTGFSSIREHQGVQFGKKEGAYLPPCSGGGGNHYSVNVKAVDKTADKNTILGEADLSLGNY